MRWFKWAVWCALCALPVLGQAQSLASTRSVQQSSKEVAPAFKTRAAEKRETETKRVQTPTPLATNPSQRKQTAPISSQGVGASLATKNQSSVQGSTAASDTQKNTLRVYDRNGRIIDGMKPAGANRVQDVRTGRYYDTVPSGDGVRIKK